MSDKSLYASAKFVLSKPSVNNRYDNEALKLANWALPLLDETPITEEWLRSVSRSPEGKTHFYFGDEESLRMFVYLSGEGNWCAIVGSDARRVPYASGGFQIKTRGIVRQLASALGIQLPTGAKP